MRDGPLRDRRQGAFLKVKHNDRRGMLQISRIFLLLDLSQKIHETNVQMASSCQHFPREDMDELGAEEEKYYGEYISVVATYTSYAIILGNLIIL